MKGELDKGGQEGQEERRRKEVILISLSIATFIGRATAETKSLQVWTTP